MSTIVIDQVKPELILQKLRLIDIAFAEAFKGEGHAGDGNFQDFNTSWRTEAPTDVAEIWLEMLRREMLKASRAKFNFVEFWGWPEIRCRDDGTSMVAARIRVGRVKIEHIPRMIHG